VKVLEDGVTLCFAARQVDLDARRRLSGGFLVGNTFAMDDPPKRLTIGMGRGRRQVRRGGRAEASDQQRPSDEGPEAHDATR
jgi:hypothetical protein